MCVSVDCEQYMSDLECPARLGVCPERLGGGVTRLESQQRRPWSCEEEACVAVNSEQKTSNSIAKLENCQGYLTHKEHPPARTLQNDYPGSYGGPRGGGCSLGARYPCI